MEKMIHICMISDDNYVMPTSVAIQSMIDSKPKDVSYTIHIIASALSAETEEQFRKFSSDTLLIDIIRENAEKRFSGYHDFDPNSICAASISALLKFVIADLLPNLERVLYLDGDLIVKTNLEEIYYTDIRDYYAAAVVDSGSIYFKHEYVKKVKNYFNSGVMLLNLNKIREDNMVAVLLKTKKELKDTSLMDQNVFNLVFDGKVKLLPVIYNFMPVSLYRSDAKWNIEQINCVYGTDFDNKKQLYASAKIIHYSSKDKPWKVMDGACASMWIDEYLRTPIDHDLLKAGDKGEDKAYPCVISVIMPCYNVENYVQQTVKSILEQTFQNFEIICIDDGSTDNTLKILKELAEKSDKIRVYADENHGQGYQRNKGIKYAQGKYVYFMDSDDLLEPFCFETLFRCAENNRLDVVYFEGDSFYENSKLEAEFPQYKTTYNRKNAYPKVYSGEELYVKFRFAGELIVSPCLQFIRCEYLRENNIWFPDLPLMEDNLFTFWTILKAQRTKCLPDILFHRRVRSNSTMTAKRDIDRIKALTVTILETMKEFDKREKDSPIYRALYTHLRGYFKNLLSSYKMLSAQELAQLRTLLSKEEWIMCMFALYDEQEQKRYDETSSRLRKAWQEKSEINRKLQSCTRKNEHAGGARMPQNEDTVRGKDIMKKIKAFIKKICPCTYSKLESTMGEFRAQLEEYEAENNSNYDRLLQTLKENRADTHNMISLLQERGQETAVTENGDQLKKIQDLLESLTQNIAQMQEIQNQYQSLTSSLNAAFMQYSAQNTKTTNELVWAQVFNNSIENSSWLLDKSFSPGRWAMGYLELYLLYRVLNEFRPLSILELGLGQSTKMIVQYIKANPDAHHCVVEHDAQWIQFYENNNSIPENTTIYQLDREMVPYKDAQEVRVFSKFKETFEEKSFDFIVIDAPLGGDMKQYSRIDVLSILPKSLKKSFVIILDDAERSGELHAANEITNVLTEEGYKFRTVTYRGEKNVRLWASEDWGFLCSL